LSTSRIPIALHRAESELPFATIAEGLQVQVVQADISAGFWVTRMRAAPGLALQRHKHTGEVFAFTVAGSWKYLEYPEVNTAGSFLYEPAGSVHTLYVPNGNATTTDVWFVIYGAILYLDDHDNVESISDPGSALDRYLNACREAGYTPPNVMIA
jgi:quercetin dioxygenase-like cupin family protein